VVDVRVIAATNRNLPEMVAAGTFREDLLYRLRVVHLHVPPLRERPEDIRTLGAYFLAQSECRTTLSEPAWKMLETHRWPGNVRELQNVIEQVTWLAVAGEPVTAAQLPSTITGPMTTLTPVRERRRELADELFRMLTEGGYTFWEPVHRMFLNRDITRHDVRELVRCGLRETRGNYRTVVSLFNLPSSDYKKFMNFLATHDCRPEFREFRTGSANPERSRRALFTDAHRTAPIGTPAGRPQAAAIA
jgi:DNA-binding NtrC family response regulator